jgi:hypothetical protein
MSYLGRLILLGDSQPRKLLWAEHEARVGRRNVYMILVEQHSNNAGPSGRAV